MAPSKQIQTRRDVLPILSCCLYGISKKKFFLVFLAHYSFLFLALQLKVSTLKESILSNFLIKKRYIYALFDNIRKFIKIQKCLFNRFIHHPFRKTTISTGRIIHKNMSHSTHQFTILNDRTPTHTLDDPTCSF